MNLRPKILLSYTLILGLLLLTLGWSLYNLSLVSQASTAILQENYRSILAANNMLAALERQDSSVLTFVVNQNNTAVATFRANEIEFLTWLNRAQDNVTLASEPPILSNIEASYLTFLEAFTALRNLPPADQELYYAENVYPTFQNTRLAIEELRGVNQTAMVASFDQAIAVAERAVLSTLGFGLVLFGVGVAASWLLAERLTKPLAQIQAATVQIAEGNYEVELAIETQDELGNLARQINLMSRKLRSFQEMNVSQLLAAKQRNEAVIQSIADGILVVDDKYEVVNLNPRAAQMLRVNPNTAVGQHFLMLIEDRQLFRQLQEISPQTPDSRTYTLAIPQPNEAEPRHTYYQITLTPIIIKVKPRKMAGVVLVLHDITEQKRLDQRKSEFILTASHELRTPLTGLNMSVELLYERLQNHPDTAVVEIINTAREEGQHLRSLIQDLLDLSKLETGQANFQCQPTPLADIFHQAYNLLAQRAAELGKTITWPTVDPAIMVNADAPKLLRVIGNLIENALLYTDANGQITLTVAVETDMADTAVVHCQIADNGPGIPEAEQKAVFDKFVQGVSSRQMGGSGLGLAISQEIIQQHGGRIWLESVVGQGSTFHFTIPLAVKL
jgi:two-component system, NtrC family, sensor histidine kinase KinB